MAGTDNIAAWIILVTGVYALAAGIGEVRNPGGWDKMKQEFAQSTGLTFLMGMLNLVLGTILLLINPLDLSNWQSIFASAIGAFIFFEGIAFLAFPDLMVRARGMVKQQKPVFAWAAAGAGIALIVIGYVGLLAS